MCVTTNRCNIKVEINFTLNLLQCLTHNNNVCRTVVLQKMDFSESSICDDGAQHKA